MGVQSQAHWKQLFKATKLVDMMSNSTRDHIVTQLQVCNDLAGFQWSWNEKLR
jgi:hypothetical protein